MVHGLNEAFDALKAKSEDGRARSTKDPIFFSMGMIACIGKIVEQHESDQAGICHYCQLPAPCPTMKTMLDHSSGRAFQD